MYALRLAEDGRILEIMDIRYQTEETPVVEDYPQEVLDGCAYHYRYVDGEWIYDPIQNNPIAPRNIVVDEYVCVDNNLYKAITNIPSGEPIITGQNAIATTIEEQLAELAKGE